MKIAALAGADVATLPFKVLEQLYNHPLTKNGLDQFLADHAKSKRSKPDCFCRVDFRYEIGKFFRFLAISPLVTTFRWD